jgi:hypothetical protein
MLIVLRGGNCAVQFRQLEETNWGRKNSVCHGNPHSTSGQWLRALCTGRHKINAAWISKTIFFRVNSLLLGSARSNQFTSKKDDFKEDRYTYKTK